MIIQRGYVISQFIGVSEAEILNLSRSSEIDSVAIAKLLQISIEDKRCKHQIIPSYQFPEVIINEIHIEISIHTAYVEQCEGLMPCLRAPW